MPIPALRRAATCEYNSARRASWFGVTMSGMTPRPPRGGSDGHLVEVRLEIALAEHADHLLCHFAVLENQEGWHGANAVLDGNLPVIVDVDFADFHLAVVFAGDFIENRRDHFAGAAPFGPEIHQHRRGRLE